MLRSNIAGRKANTIDCPGSPPSWLAGGLLFSRNVRVGFRAIIRALDRGELDCDHVWLFDVRTAHPIARHCEHCGKREYRKDVNDD